MNWNSPNKVGNEIKNHLGFEICNPMITAIPIIIEFGNRIIFKVAISLCLFIGKFSTLHKMKHHYSNLSLRI